MSKPSITVAAGEREVVNVSLDRQLEPFALALTDRAVYIFQLSRRSFTRQYSVQRLPVEQVTRVAVQRTRFGAKLLWSTIMIVSGCVLTFLMALPLLNGGDSTTVTLIPILLIMGGLVLPFTARNHRTLRIEFIGREPYVWKPSFFMADVTKRHVTYLMEKVVRGFRGLRIYVHEDYP